MKSSLNQFHSFTSTWFTEQLGTPTPVQEKAWPAIASGQNTLVSAPTGTGKTLSAFLVFIDRLKDQTRKGILKPELQLIYISPLKSLAGDIRENLRRPLQGIYQVESREFSDRTDNPYDIRIAIRTGDTTAKERKQMLKTPPHILITTPESLYLLLTSGKGKEMLRTAKAVIVDELHALIDSKRGSHLMFSLARLDRLCEHPLQRIGLSATIQPLSLAAEYLSPDPVTVIAPAMTKQLHIDVVGRSAGCDTHTKDSVWKDLASTVYSYCLGARSVIAFCDGRMYSEKLAFYVNQIAGDGFARTHHGSLSKEQRFEVEESLRDGQLRLLCATSSMELGIDVGEIDLVLQIGCPRSVSGALQRLGRAGHNPGRTSSMTIFPKTPSEGLYCGMTAQLVREGRIEPSRPPEGCYDILAQHLVSMAASGSYSVDDVMELLPRAYPFRMLTRTEVNNILCMLSGDYEHEHDLPVRPRILYDRIHETVEGDTYSRMLAVSAGGTIPDKGMYAARTSSGVKIGELDEEYVYEARVGDRFLLGTFAWKITDIRRDEVCVEQTGAAGARLPFWKGDVRGRNYQTGLQFGRMLRQFNSLSEQSSEKLYSALEELGLDSRLTEETAGLLSRQIKQTGVLPDDRTMIAEHFRDETGCCQLMIHSCFGRQINAPLALLLQNAAAQSMNTNVNFVDDDDGFLLFPYNESPVPQGLLQTLDPDSSERILEAVLPTTPLFNITFRYNTAHALMMGVRKTGRQPLWVQRLRSAQILDTLIQYPEHPLIQETKRECLQYCWDLPGLSQVLQQIRSGQIRVHEIYTDIPSSLSLPLRRQTEAAMMYDYSPTPKHVISVSEQALMQAVSEGKALLPDPELLAKSGLPAKLPEDELHLHSFLMTEGDLVAGELDIPLQWLESLVHQERVCYIEPGLWIAAEQSPEYEAALILKDHQALLRIVRRVLRYRGAHTSEQLAERYLISNTESNLILAELCEQQLAVECDGRYYHAALFKTAQLETVRSRRFEYHTQPASRYTQLQILQSRTVGSSADQLEETIKSLLGYSFAPAVWESVLLPARVNGYCPALLDALLSQGEYYWQFTTEQKLMFLKTADIDWNAPALFETVSDSELVPFSLSVSVQPDSSVGEASVSELQSKLLNTLKQRGASFMKTLSGLFDTPALHLSLLELAANGLIHADSFVPVRQYINKEKIISGSTRQLINSRVLALTTGRFELSRPSLIKKPDDLLKSEFDRSILLCRETVRDISWPEALTALRVLEYTGQVRRGYFIEGLSGIQFIRESDFMNVLPVLENDQPGAFWLPAADPALPYGKSLPHETDRSFLTVSGTLVGLYAGHVEVLFERSGHLMRVFEYMHLAELLQNFCDGFQKKRFYSSGRLVIKQYPAEAEPYLTEAGFLHEMHDYVLYRK